MRYVLVWSASIVKRYFLIKRLNSSRNRFGRRKRARLKQIFLSPLSIMWRPVSFWIDYPLRRRIHDMGKFVCIYNKNNTSHTAWLIKLGDKFRECARINFLSENFDKSHHTIFLTILKLIKLVIMFLKKKKKVLIHWHLNGWNLDT